MMLFIKTYLDGVVRRGIITHTEFWGEGKIRNFFIGEFVKEDCLIFF